MSPGEADRRDHGMGPSSDHWNQVTRLFDAALAASPDVRAQMLAQAAADVATRVAELLRAFDGPDEPLSVDPLAMAAAVADVESDIVPGGRLGPYEIVREIGRGGMGSVFEAVRADADFTKRVAIKTIAIGRGAPEVEARFRRERRILARLEHRHIAALLDGGVTARGTPWFAMELVVGEPIDHYCERRRVSLRDRVNLLRQVAGAVHRAHQSLVVHRDLKPGNILVTADGTVKLLDFGIARLLVDDDATGGADRTEGVAAPVTTAFASPEQLRGDPVTTACDIHALGIVGYLVLAGRHPWRDGSTPLSEVRRRILEVDPASPGVDPDLDAIIAMALRKEPDRRYGSAELFGDDLLRWTKRLPVVARGDGYRYRVGRYLRRNAIGLVATAVTLAGLAIGVVAARGQAAVAARERDRARVEAAKATRVTEFVQTMLRQADPRAGGASLTVAAALGGAGSRAESTLAGDPEVLASVVTAIGQSYRGLGLAASAIPLFERALAIHRRLATGPDGRVARSLGVLAEAHNDIGAIGAAESLLVASVAESRRMSRPDSSGLIASLTALGDVLQYRNDLEGAERAQREALEIASRTRGPSSAEAAAAINNLAVIMGQRRDWVAAESLHRVAVGLAVTRLGPDHPDVAVGLNGLANDLQELGRVAEAESTYRRALALRIRVLGPDHPELAWSYTNLGWLLLQRGRLEEALGAADSVAAIRRRRGRSADTPIVASALVLRGQSLLGLKRPMEAVAALREALRLREASLPADHWAIAVTESVLGEAWLDLGDRARAGRLLGPAYRRLLAARGPDHPLTRQARSRLDRLGT